MEGDDYPEEGLRLDDEKTVREDRIENAWVEKKNNEQVDRSESTVVAQSESTDDRLDPVDDFPDGGLKAWLCALGVSNWTGDKSARLYLSGT